MSTVNLLKSDNDEDYIYARYEERFKCFEYLRSINRSKFQSIEYSKLGDWIYNNPEVLKIYRIWQNEL